MRQAAVAAILATLCASCRDRPAGRPRPNVLLITIDTWRADRLGSGSAPALDRLAESAVRFTAARTAVPLTLPSHATILTGLLPPAHGVRENGIDQLDASHPTLATLLKGAGYDTAAFVGAYVLDRRFGLARGFDTYDDQIPRDPKATERLEAERPASVVVDRALAWLDARRTQRPAPGTQHPAPSTQHPAPSTQHPAPSTQHPAPSTQHPAPFFVWIHVYDPHAPYDAPEGSRRSSPYDAEVAYTDSQLARVLGWLPAAALKDRTLVVVAGDHGEGLGEHGEQTHGMLLYDSTLHVPLVVAAPGVAPAKRDEAVSLADIAPTVLRVAGVTPSAEMKGRDLLEVRLKVDPTYIYGETEYPRVAGWAPLQALTDGRWKTIRAGAASEVYDLQTDPRELRDLSSSQPNVVSAMTRRIAALRAGSATPAARSITPEAEQRLRSLGYVASSAQATTDPNAPNPATKIGEWNAFEDALTSLNAQRSDTLRAVEALAKRNNNAMVFQVTYARALKDAGQVDRAVAVYRDAARRWPTDATLLHDLAVAARDAAGRASGPAAAKLRAEAAAAEQATIALAPSSAMAHNGLGLIAVDEDRARDAAAAFQRATEIDSTNASYWANLGNARRALGDPAGAEQAYRRALDVDARAADAANGLGVLLVEAKRPAEAIPWLERAAAMPDFVEARLNLGIALQEAGQTARAAEAYRSVLAAPPGFKREREAAAQLLASLGASR